MPAKIMTVAFGHHASDCVGRLRLRRAGVAHLAIAAALTVCGVHPIAAAPDAETPASAQAPAASDAQSKAKANVRFAIDEYRVEGADELPQIEVEEAVYPFLGPGRTTDDVEKARAALEKAYHDKGFQTVTVSVPQQNALGGVIVLKVTEGRVARLRIKGSRFYDLAAIKKHAPSLAEGKLPNFGAVTKDIVALNQWPDRRVTPALRAGTTPGMVDVDLNVEDKMPVHGSLELNNRASPNTTDLRLNASARYENLWQLGHSFTFSYQVAPQKPEEAQVFSGSYLARSQDIEWLSLLLYAVKSNSNVATIGDTNVVGPGHVIGTRAIITLPTRDGLFHTISAGIDYKHFDQDVRQADSSFSSPIDYYPIVTNYTATFQGENRLTQLNAGLTFGTRGLGSDPETFDNKRFKASGSFLYFRGDVSHTQDLPGGVQLYGKAQGQVADSPLVSSEQFSAGGLDTVRGYLESEVVGDNGVAGTIELRSPNISEWLVRVSKDNAAAGGAPANAPVNQLKDWRFFLFTDAAYVTVNQPLPEQTSRFDLASYGIGTRIKLSDYLNGAVTYAVAINDQAFTQAHQKRLLFRVWGEF
jgi:hemolysin activation/secretion protein